ncbi:DsbC family protein [Undibacterium sp. TJN25]|uniref:DsbC family protein n=1 Tax=Undibacterium sp. TJN25 TaxID=3413056 RepID=UPI003BF20D5F
MMNVKNILAALMMLVSASVFAETAQETAVKKLVEPRLGEGVVVDSVTKTPYAGLFEVRIGSEILYTDEKAKFLFVGSVIDSQTSVDYTKNRIADLNKIKFSDLPLDAAVKMVKGNGKRVVAIFEDPNCGFCKKFRHTLQGVDNITVYTFMYNILAEDSATKSKNVWCSADKSKAWDDWMLNGKAAPVAAASCNTPNDKVYELGRKLNVSGTPTIFFADGTRMPGAVDAKTFEAKLASLK